MKRMGYSSFWWTEKSSWMKRMLSIVFVLVVSLSSTSAQVIINEVMQSNIDCYVDDLNDFPDSWVEIYNGTSSTIYLSNYKIGLTSDPSAAYKLPYKAVAAGAYELILCDKVGSGMHTDFRLESAKGGEIYLFNGNDVIDKITGMAKQPAPNISYGRVTTGATKWGFQLQPTPKSANTGGIATSSTVLDAPVFSIPGQVYSYGSTMSLTLSLPASAPQGAYIKYTNDGSEPTTSSITYSSPITINKTTVIRAKVFCQGYLSPRSTTQSYIFHGRNVTLPVVSITTRSSYFYDTKFGIYVDGSYSSSKKNYEFDWRRPINLEVFEGANVNAVINQLCETRIQGGASRGNQLKSLAFYANKRFGEKNFKYEFFPEDKPGLTKFKSFILRNAGNDFDYTYMRDAIMQRTMGRNCDLDFQGYSPAIVYINGTYLGMLNFRERSNEDYVESNYDGLEDIDMIENWWDVKAGDPNAINVFKDFYNSHDHTYAEYNDIMDLEEYQNLMITNIFFDNEDFPGNNICQWRPQGEGGRWRWICKDTDFGLGLYGQSAQYPTLNWLHNPDYNPDRSWANQWDHTRLFRRLEEIQQFKDEFIDRCAVYMGDFLNYNYMNPLITSMYNKVSYEYPYHRKLINQWWPNFSDEVNNTRNYVNNRVPFVYKHLADYYYLGTPQNMTVNKGLAESQTSKMEVKINNIPLTKGVFNGQFYRSRKITVSGTTTETGKYIKGWEVKVTNGSTTTQTYNTPEFTITMPTCSLLAINAILGDATDGIEQVAEESFDDSSSKYVYDTSGALRQVLLPTESVRYNLPSGMYIVKQGRKTGKLMVK